MTVSVEVVPDPPTEGPETVTCTPAAETATALPDEPPERLTGAVVDVTLWPPTLTLPLPGVTLEGTGIGASDGLVEELDDEDEDEDEDDEPPDDEPPPVPPPPPPLAVGVTALEAADAAEVPAPFVAVVVNVYEVPAVSPVTEHDVAGTVTTQEPPAGTEVTVYDETVPPEEGAVTVTVAEVAPATAVGVPGIPGAATTTAADEAEAAEVPVPFVAVDVKV